MTYRLNIIDPPIGRNSRLIFIHKQIILPLTRLFINGAFRLEKPLLITPVVADAIGGG